VRPQYRHTYSGIPNSATPFHFRFSVSSDVFRDPSAFGRPVGVFNADCYGFTPQDPGDTRMKVKLSEDPNTSRRFPCASAFVTREEAALECDFWKLVLRRKYFLELPWSHETLEAFLEASQLANHQHPLERLEDESKWSHELLDFINEHLSMLHKHRDAHKPELDLDEWEKTAKRLPSRALFVWVQQVRAAQQSLDALPATERLYSLSKSISHLRAMRLPDYNSKSEFHYDLSTLAQAIGSSFHAAGICDRLIADIEDKRRERKAALATLIKNRPAAIPDTDSGTPLHYQSNVS